MFQRVSCVFLYINYRKIIFSDETCITKLFKEINYAIKQATLERKVNEVNENYAIYTIIYAKGGMVLVVVKGIYK